MKLRLMGTQSEIERMLMLLNWLEDSNEIVVRDVSGFYKNRPPSIEGRVYVEID